MPSSSLRFPLSVILLAISALLSPLYLAYGWVLRCDCHPLWGMCHCGMDCHCPKYWSLWMGAIALVALVATTVTIMRRRKLFVGKVVV